MIQQATPRLNRMLEPHKIHENKAVVSNLTSAFEYRPKRYFSQYRKLARLWKIGHCSSIPGEVRNFSLEYTPTIPTEQSDKVIQAAIYKEIKRSTTTFTGVRICGVVMCAVWYLNTTSSE